MSPQQFANMLPFQNSGELLNVLIYRFHPDSLNWELQKLDLKAGMYRCLCVLVCICGAHQLFPVQLTPRNQVRLHLWSSCGWVGLWD